MNPAQAIIDIRKLMLRSKDTNRSRSNAYNRNSTNAISIGPIILTGVISNSSSDFPIALRKYLPNKIFEYQR